MLLIFIARQEYGAHEHPVNHPHSVPNPQAQHSPRCHYASNNLLCPKGGTTGIVCKPYTHLHKIQLVKECARLRLVHNLSLRGAARALGVNHTLLIRWKAKLSALKVAHGKSCCRVNKEHIGQIDPVKEELLAWIFTRCNQRITVTKSQVVFKASAKIHYFGVKSFKACFKSVSCFLGQHGYVYCLKTNEALHLPHEVYMRTRRHSISS